MKENLRKEKIYSEDALQTIAFLIFDQNFYKTPKEINDNTLQQIKILVSQANPKMLRDTVMWHKKKSISSHTLINYIASHMAPYVSGAKWASIFYYQLIESPRDIYEMMSYHKRNNGSLSNSMKKGLKKAFDKFCDEDFKESNLNIFQISEMIRTIHPKPTNKNMKTLESFKVVQNNENK